jgi:ACS family tartrate transporter-like MFS transporter
MSKTVSDALIKKVSARLIPMLFFSYVLAYLDRINVGFAALKMNADIGISTYIFGLVRAYSFSATSSSKCQAILLLQKWAPENGSRGS